jgi:hypothetical protein
MAPGLDLELTPLGANGEAEPRTRFYGTGPSFSPARLTMNPPESELSGCPVDYQVIVAGQIVNDISVTTRCRARTRRDPGSVFLAHRSMAAPGSWRRRTNNCPWATAS